MRDRLVELLKDVKFNPFDQFNIERNLNRIIDVLLANGVIVLPCKVGDVVYFVHEVCDENAEEYLDISVGEVVSFSIQKEGLWMYCRYEDGLTYWHLVDDEFGKTVFLTREEAEAKLKEGGKG